MMRQTGGTAVGEISTRSSPFCLAMASACGGGMMPSCAPVSSITRISRTRMRSLTRTRSSRRGLLSKAIGTSVLSFYFDLFRLHGAFGNFVLRQRDEIGHRAWALVAAGARSHRHRALGALPVADDQHVRHLLQLSLSNLISDLFLPLVEFHTQPGLGKLLPDR